MNSPEIGLILWVGRMTRSMKAKSSSKCTVPLLECAVNPRGGIAFCELLKHHIWSEEDDEAVHNAKDAAESLGLLLTHCGE